MYVRCESFGKAYLMGAHRCLIDKLKDKLELMSLGLNTEDTEHTGLSCLSGKAIPV